MPAQQKSVPSSLKDLKRKAQGASQAPTNEAEDVQNHTQETNGEHEVNGEAQTNGEYHEDGEVTEAIPAGNVDQDGNVVTDEGRIIGKVNGDNASRLEGNLVDQEGDVLDAEGNIIGQAELEDAVTDVASTVEKPELAAPFGTNPLLHTITCHLVLTSQRSPR